ncbi:unnamed protein product [Effrenium voratum]|nr:unnamed protein product [Effrenium voratum]
MAATIAMVQPYIQPQMNELHIFSLLCLAAAALGFAGAADPEAHWLWLSRVSVLLPFLLAAVQALRPDSCEALAVRLFQESPAPAEGAAGGAGGGAGGQDCQLHLSAAGALVLWWAPVEIPGASRAKRQLKMTE